MASCNKYWWRKKRWNVERKMPTTISTNEGDVERVWASERREELKPQENTLILAHLRNFISFHEPILIHMSLSTFVCVIPCHLWVLVPSWTFFVRIKYICVHCWELHMMRVYANHQPQRPLQQYLRFSTFIRQIEILQNTHTHHSRLALPLTNAQTFWKPYFISDQLARFGLFACPYN